MGIVWIKVGRSMTSGVRLRGCWHIGEMMTGWKARRLGIGRVVVGFSEFSGFLAG